MVLKIILISINIKKINYPNNKNSDSVKKGDYFCEMCKNQARSLVSKTIPKVVHNIKVKFRINIIFCEKK